MSKKFQDSSGYRLHKDRILFSGGEIMRTIKYPLIVDENNPNSERILKKFKQAVINDDRVIRGDINLNDFLKNTSEGKRIYTLFDFWLDSLRAGVIWADKTATLTSYRETFFPATITVKDRIWENSSERIKKFFDKDKFYNEFLTKVQIRSNSTARSFESRLKNCVKKSITDEEEKNEFIKALTNRFFDKSGKLKYDTFGQDKVWKSFGLDKSIINQSKPQGRLQNITFLIIPDLINLEEKSIEELIKRRRKWLSRYINSEDVEKWLEKILDLGSNFNSYSNYFNKILTSLRDGEVQEIYEALSTFLPAEYVSKGDVLNSLEFLSQKARQIPDVSMLITSWADYRSVFGGRIQSWFSNFIKRQSEIDEKILLFKSNLQKAKNYLNSLNVNKAKDDVKDLQQLIDRLDSISNEISNEDVKKEKEFEIFDSLLSSLRRRLNFFYQQYLYDEAKEEDNVRKNEKLKGIYENIEKPVAFYGERQQRKNEKFVEDTIPILEDGIVFLTELITALQKTFSPESTFEVSKRKKETEENLYRRELQFIWSKLKDLAVNSPEFRKEYKEILESVCLESTAYQLFNKESTGRFAFYKNEHAKGNVEEIELRNIKEGYLIQFKNLIIHLITFLTQFGKDELLKDKNLLLDWVELAKNIVANLVRFNANTEFSLDKKRNLRRFEKAKNYLNLFKLEKVKKNEFGFIIQSLILSEIKGAATLYSKQKYIASYSVQIVGSNSRFKLFYQSLDNSIDISSSEKKELMKKHRYLVAYDELKKINKNATEGHIKLLRLDKKQVAPFTAYNDDLVSKTFLLSSSPYQLQFLDKYLYRPKGWEDINITLGEWSFIVEEAYKIKWDLGTKRPIFERDLESNRNKLYLAIPFTLKATENKKDFPLSKIVLEQKDKKDYSRDKNRLKYPILGIDVGEYGLAWCLVKFDYNQEDKNFLIRNIDIIGKGFIEDRNIGKIKDYFAEIQQKSRLGAYNEDDTTIARVRENAIGKLRNVIHAIVTGSPDGASLIYEDAISNFETGSGRTTKIYHSVKRADTEFESEADKAEHSLVWGRNSRYIGRNVGAYASSYICAKCLKSIFEIKKNDLSDVTIGKPEGNILTLRYKDSSFFAYSKDKNTFYKSRTFSPTEENLKDLRKMVKDFARPPLIDSEVIEKFVKDKKILDEKNINRLKSTRGNSCIFVCPFCQFVADADVQAAFMMAMRGYLRFSGIVPPQKDSQGNPKNSEEQPKTGDTFLEKTAEYLKQLEPEVKHKIINAVKIDSGNYTLTPNQ